MSSARVLPAVRELFGYSIWSFLTSLARIARAQLENTRARILQILQLDKENEQLLLRCSLSGGRPAPTAAPAASVAMLQKIYARCS